VLQLSILVRYQLTITKEFKMSKVKNPTKFEIETLKEIAKNNDCTMEQLIDALMGNVVREQISIQIEYNKNN
jgi:hypothetical protein